MFRYLRNWLNVDTFKGCRKACCVQRLRNKIQIPVRSGWPCTVHVTRESGSCYDTPLQSAVLWLIASLLSVTCKTIIYKLVEHLNCLRTRNTVLKKTNIDLSIRPRFLAQIFKIWQPGKRKNLWENDSISDSSGKLIDLFLRLQQYTCMISDLDVPMRW